jgi:hypothetical protein
MVFSVWPRNWKEGGVAVVVECLAVGGDSVGGGEDKQRWWQRREGSTGGEAEETCQAIEVKGVADGKPNST